MVARPWKACERCSCGNGVCRFNEAMVARPCKATMDAGKLDDVTELQ